MAPSLAAVPVRGSWTWGDKTMFGLGMQSKRREPTTKHGGALLGLDIGSFSLKAVRLTPSKPGPRLDQVRITPFERPLAASDPEGALDQIAAALTESRLGGSRWKPTPIACTLPSSVTQMRLIDAPSDEDGEHEEMILRELSAEDSDRGEDWLGDYWPTHSSGATIENSQLGIVGARRSWVEALITLFEERGLEPRIVDGEPFTIARALRRAENRSEEIQAALDFGYDGAFFVLARRGIPNYFRVLRGCGTRGVSEAIQHGLNIDEREAHQFLKACSQAARRPSAASKTMLTTLRDLAALPLRRLQNELARTLDFARRQADGGEVKRIMLLGGGALLPGMSSLLESWADLEFRLWSMPLDPLSESYSDSLPMLAQAIALAEVVSAE
jgi:Tfp pilus assembly PilM family ATPase